MLTVLKVSAFLTNCGLAGRAANLVAPQCCIVTETDVPTDCKTHSLGEEIMNMFA
jgi:hypothetical protein